MHNKKFNCFWCGVNMKFQLRLQFRLCFIAFLIMGDEGYVLTWGGGIGDTLVSAFRPHSTI